MTTKYRLYRFELGRLLFAGLTLREARVSALAYVREPLPF